MAKNISKKKNYTKNPIVLLILLVLVIAGYFLYGFIRTEIDKREFKQIGGDINNIVSSLQSGGLNNVKKNQYCQKDQVKLGEGQLRCLIELSYNFSLENRSMQDVVQRAIEYITDHSFTLKSGLNSNSASDRGQYTHNKTEANCYLSYETNSEVKVVDFNFYCVKPVYKAIYP